MHVSLRVDDCDNIGVDTKSGTRLGNIVGGDKIKVFLSDFLYGMFRYLVCFCSKAHQNFISFHLSKLIRNVLRPFQLNIQITIALF